jgi:hypothetical protein
MIFSKSRLNFRILLPVAILMALLVYLMVWRVRVGMTRYFDVDEFSYLHWTANIVKGLTPYKDYFLVVTPGFLWVLAPFVWFASVSTKIFLIGRVIALVIFAGILAQLGVLFGMTRSRKWAVLPMVILAFLPMPYDKFLEIRPDNLSTLLALTGLVLEVFLLTHHGKRERLLWFLCGVFYSVSLLVLAKAIPFVIIGFAVPVLPVIGKFMRSAKMFRWQDAGNFITLLAGFVLPLAGFFFWTIANGSLPAAWYLLTRAPIEIYYHLQYYMGADLFFYPNASFYGGVGNTITPGFIVNHTMWIVALVAGAYRLVTPIRAGKKNETLAELLVAGIFFVSAAAFIKFFPLKHSQYLIPIAVFVAYYAADGLSVFFDWLERVGGYISLGIVLLGFAYLLIVVNKNVNAPKLLDTNRTQLTEFTTLLTTIPLSARVVDLDGRMLFWRDAYPICCLPFDEYVPLLSHPPQSLYLYLSSHPADYIYDGDSSRLAELSPENLAYIRAHFTPVAGFGERLWKKK